MSFECDICERHFSRNHDMMRHKLKMHPEDEEEDAPSESEDQSDTSNPESDEDGQETDDPIPGVWNEIVGNVLESFRDTIIETAGEELDIASIQKAYKDVLPEIRKAIREEYLRLNNNWLDLKPDPIHREIMKTKLCLEEMFEFPPEEALNNAVRMRKDLFDQVLPSEYPIQRAEYADDETLAI